MKCISIYGRGGHNKTHDQVEDYMKLDSFLFRECVSLLEEKNRDDVEGHFPWGKGGNIGFVLYQTRLQLLYSIGGYEVRESFYFSKVPNNYGGIPRLYFICPYCGKTARYIYMHKKHFKCRKCANLNYNSQQITKGEDIHARRMLKILRNDFGIKESISAFDASMYRPERPKGMHNRTYLKHLIRYSKERDKYISYIELVFKRIDATLNKYTNKK